MSDYMFVLESHLEPGQSRAVAEIQRIATAAGMNVWLTGGAMRDVLRGARIADLDFAVERDALKTGRQLAETLRGRVLQEDPLKRWVELELAEGTRASVANIRTEKYSKPGGKPQIAPASIHEDLLRRDFTINAIGLSLNRGSRGLLIDPANGQADLVNRELRATNPYIFFDDPSRIFRLVRFQHSLGFTIGSRLEMQLENALTENYQESAPASALAGEIRALAPNENASAALEAYERMGLLKLISPALAGKNLNIAGIARFEKLVYSVLPAGAPGSSLAFLYVFMENLGPREKSEVLKTFDLPKKDLEALKQIDARAKKLEAHLRSARITKPSHVYEILKDAGADDILLVLYRSPHRVVQDRIRAFYGKYLPRAQEVTEDQVAGTGVKSGTPKFEKAWRDMVNAHLNARPRKPTPIEETPAFVPPSPSQPQIVRNLRK
jgi:tRNA nucleotidyltransferase (CCA-adding enzyme)